MRRPVEVFQSPSGRQSLRPGVTRKNKDAQEHDQSRLRNNKRSVKRARVLNAAAPALGFSSVQALQAVITAFATV
jgi:hypothetical protein